MCSSDLWGEAATGPIFTNATLDGTDLFSAATRLNGFISGGVTGSPLLPAGYVLTGPGTGVAQSDTVGQQGFIVGPGVNMSGVDLSGMDLTGVDLDMSVLVGANLSDTTLTGTSLNGWMLGRAALTRGMNLSGADMTNAMLHDAD